MIVILSNLLVASITIGKTNINQRIIDNKNEYINLLLNCLEKIIEISLSLPSPKKKNRKKKKVYVIDVIFVE